MKNTPENWVKSPHLAEVKLIYKTKSQPSSVPVINSPDSAYEYLMSIWDKEIFELQEEFFVVLLNNALNVLGFYKVSKGGKTATIVDISHVLCVAVLSNAHSILLAHNHPSGYLKASSADIRLTRRISDALDNIGIHLRDHLILTTDGYYSFKEHKLLN
ncbi:MAG: JAB domain-containing protein [Balneolaceae bacterium]|nr:JAB domain-containing protein [Balneolaceae bacterium]